MVIVAAQSLPMSHNESKSKHSLMGIPIAKRRNQIMFKRFFSNNKLPSDYTVLVVEDDQPIRQTIIDILQDEGYKVLSAYNGEDALKVLDGVDMPDGCIVDLMMPDMGGREFVDRARLRFGRIDFAPVLVLTAARHGEMTANTMEVNDFLPKPFEHDVLLQHVANLVQQRKSAPSTN